MSTALTHGQNPIMGEEIRSAIACCTAAFVYTLCFISFKQIMYTEHALGTYCSSFCTDLCFLTPVWSSTLKNVFVSPLLVSYVTIVFSVYDTDRERERETFMLYKPSTPYLYNSPLPGSWNFFTVLHLVQTRMQLNRKFVGRRRRRPQSAWT